MKNVTKINQIDFSIFKKTRVAAYCRVSTDSDEQELSLDTQKNHYESYIKANSEWEYAGIYYDDGVSGTKTAKRDGLLRLMEDCEKGLIDLVITKSISRFSRNTTDCLALVRKLLNYEVYVIFEKENINTGSMESELMLAVLTSMAESESRSISENEKWGIKKRFQNGTYVISYPPYGYANVDGEEIQIRLTERKKQNPNSSNRCDNNNNIFSGELQFYIYHSSSFHSPTLVHDTAYTKIEDKIISIVAYLEIEADNRKTERIEAEEREKRRKEEERKREEFEEEKRKELEDFKDLLYSAERFRKTNILREYINAFENHAIEDGETDDELLAKIQWAREKADWLDPFIAKKDNYLNSYDMDRILQAAVPVGKYTVG